MREEEARHAAEVIATEVSKMTYAEWSRVREEVNKRFSVNRSKARVDDPALVREAIESGLDFF